MELMGAQELLEAQELFDNIWARLPLDEQALRCGLVCAMQLECKEAVYHLTISLEAMRPTTPETLVTLGSGWSSLDAYALSLRYTEQGIAFLQAHHALSELEKTRTGFQNAWARSAAFLRLI